MANLDKMNPAALTKLLMFRIPRNLAEKSVDSIEHPVSGNALLYKIQNLEQFLKCTTSHYATMLSYTEVFEILSYFLATFFRTRNV